MTHVLIKGKTAIGPCQKRAGQELQHRLGGKLLELETPPLYDVEFVFGQAGQTPVMEWRKLEEELIEQVRAYGSPEAHWWEGSSFVLAGQFETTAEDDISAEGRALETLSNLRSSYGHEVEMRQPEGEP